MLTKAEQETTEWYRKSLEKDHVAESIYRRLMGCHIQLGQQADAMLTHIIEPGTRIIIAWTDLSDLPQGVFDGNNHLSENRCEVDYRACKCEVIYSREIKGNAAYDYENGVRFTEIDIKLS